MRAEGYVDTNEGRILLADSGDMINEDGKLFYRTGYAIERSGLEFGNYADYEIGEDGFGSSHSDRDFRLSQAVFHARTTLNQLDDSGFFDDARKADFSPRPN